MQYAWYAPLPDRLVQDFFINQILQERRSKKNDRLRGTGNQKIPRRGKAQPKRIPPCFYKSAIRRTRCPPVRLFVPDPHKDQIVPDVLTEVVFVQHPNVEVIILTAHHCLIAADVLNSALPVHDRRVVERLPPPCIPADRLVIAGYKSSADRFVRIVREFKNKSTDHCQPVIFGKLPQLPLAAIADGNIIREIKIVKADMASGIVILEPRLAEGLYYKVIEELMGTTVTNDSQLFLLLKEYAQAKNAYDGVKSALAQAEGSGYGIVAPKLSEMLLEKPEVFKQP